MAGRDDAAVAGREAVAPSFDPARLLVSPERADARILVIDDEAWNVRLIARLLARIGYLNVRGMTRP